MVEKKDKPIRLRVVESLQDDAYRGIARIDSALMKKLRLQRGDIIRIKGGKDSYVVVDRAYPADEGGNIIRIDGIARKNAKTGIGEFVEIDRADLKEAKKVVVAPAQQGIMIQGSSDAIKQNLLGRPVMKGDIIVMGGARKRRDIFSEDMGDFGELFGDIFSQFGMGAPGMGQMRFAIVSTNPNQPSIITENTEVILNPKAVEITEDMNIPQITYEDIGGLTDEVTKVRELVELPLKHPEIFARLGIEPPKGVLLYGPPGTGKTLLAKAVANESDAHFILLNGPEIMCVSGDTPILMGSRGYMSAERIFQQTGAVESYRNYDVKKLDNPLPTYSFKNGKIREANITHVTRLSAEAYSIKFGDGNKVVASENQPFLIYKNGDLVWETVKNIKKGDFVARLNHINLGEESFKIPIDELKKKFVLREKNKRFAIDGRNISRSNFISLPEKTSPELLELLGLLISDGNISSKDDSIGFYNLDIDLINRFKYLLKKVFGIENCRDKNDGDAYGVIAYSKLLIKYLELLGFTIKNKLNIPPYFFSLPRQEIESFIKGYFDGDGTVSKLRIKNMTYPTPVLYSVKREFLVQLQSLMLLKLGISSKIKEHRTPKGQMHKLVIRGNSGRVKFLDVGATSRKKLVSLNEIKKVIRVKEHENIPHPSLLIQSIKDNLPYKTYRNKDYYIYQSGNATKHSLRVLYDLAVRNNLLNDHIQKEFELLSREDIAWERVESLKAEGKRELFDFTVDKDSFCAAPYFLMHNSKFYGESEKKVREIFEEAEKNSPAIIFIDEIDAIAPKREDVTGEVERRVVSQLLTMLDGLNPRGKVIVIGATNRPNALDQALRRPGRFDREIEVGVPDKNGRLQILKIHTRGMPLDKDVDLEEVAAKTHGFVGADINALAKEAAMSVLRKNVHKFNLDDSEISNEVLDSLKVSKEDFRNALRVVRPSAMREVLVETPNVSWEDVGGVEATKLELREAIEWPLKYPDSFKRMGIRAPKGILLYGPPGTGKTLLAKAVAKESEANFIQVKGPELLSMWVGKSEEGVRKIFERARQVSPCIIFFDEIDSLGGKRGLGGGGSRVTESVLNQMLAEMDGIQDLTNVIVVGATNRPDMLDSALMRPGRFDRIVYVPVPEKQGRLEILRIHTKNVPIKDKEKLITKLADETEGYTGADLESLVREAAMLALREDKEAKYVLESHFKKAMEKVVPSVTKSDQERYKNIEKRYLRSAKSALPEATYMG